jgi:large subunit ribosomal protein L52
MLPQNPNAYGPLTDGPDFSYLDGKPAPPGMKQLKKMFRQQELAVSSLPHPITTFIMC